MADTPVTENRTTNTRVTDAVDAAGLTAPAWTVGAFGLAAAMRTLRVLGPLRPLATGLAVLAAAGGVLTAAPRRPNRRPDGGSAHSDTSTTRGPSVRVAAANVWYHNATPHDAVDDLIALNADVLVVSELTSDMHERLAAHFPHAIAVELDMPGTDFGHGLYARYPIQHERHATEIAGQAIVARVDAPVPFWVFALHLPRPVIVGPLGWGVIRPVGLRKAVNTTIALASKIREPVVIAGDLNLSDRTPGYRALTRHYRDAMRSAWAPSTYGDRLIWKATLLRIDHIFVSHSWATGSARRTTVRGSDHQAILVDIAILVDLDAEPAADAFAAAKR